jgi:colanic acid/amylovoran biosynthesis glycosyltransferase
MKIAYVVSLYPAVSHTFILNEVQALRRLGIEIGTFSIRRAGQEDILGAIAENEASSTKAILPLSTAELSKALLWCLSRRFRSFAGLLSGSACTRGGFKLKLKRTAYSLEGILLAYWLVQGRYEHLHCHFGNSASSPALIASKLAGIPLSITCHGSELNDPLGFQLPEKVHHTAFTACVSKFGRARLMHVCDRSDWPKIHIIRCGLSKIEPAAYPPVTGIGAEILCVGRLSSEKGHFVLFDAIEILQKRGIKAALTLVGDGPLRQELEARRQGLPNPGGVRFTGSLDPVQVAAYYRACHVVVLASFSEGVPVVLMEAFAHGRPVVATRVGGVPELVADGISGRVVSPGDAQELAEAIESVLADPARAAEMGRKGAGKIDGEFNEAISARKLKELFESAHRGT